MHHYSWAPHEPEAHIVLLCVPLICAPLILLSSHMSRVYPIVWSGTPHGYCELYVILLVYKRRRLAHNTIEGIFSC